MQILISVSDANHLSLELLKLKSANLGEVLHTVAKDMFLKDLELIHQGASHELYLNQLTKS